MKINVDNIDDYYDTINDKIDKYFGKGITPSSLKRYFKEGGHGISRFKKREELIDVDNVDRVIHDCIEDRMAMEESGIMTFENFQEKSGDYKIYFDINQDIEKTVADMYRVSLGHIEEMKGNNIKVTGVKSVKELFIFTKKQLDEILLNVCNNLCDISKEQTVEYPLMEVKISLKNFIDTEKFVNHAFSAFSNNINQHTNIIENVLSIETSEQYIFQGVKNKIFIFEKMSK